MIEVTGSCDGAHDWLRKARTRCDEIRFYCRDFSLGLRIFLVKGCIGPMRGKPEVNFSIADNPEVDSVRSREEHFPY